MLKEYVEKTLKILTFFSCDVYYVGYTRVGTLIVATTYLQLTK
jgi:hypothetical protein